LTQPVLLSARLSPTAVQHLLVETNACVMIASPRLRNIAQEALGLFPDSGLRPALSSQVPYENFLNLSEQTLGGNLGSPEHYVADTDRNVLILHSSGTTGLPKPLFMTHRYTLCFTGAHDFPNEQEAQALVISTLPLYHVRTPIMTSKSNILIWDNRDSAWLLHGCLWALENRSVFQYLEPYLVGLL